MPIQTQRFNPTQYRHHKLATTQGELDERARRQMAIDNNRAYNAAQMANMRANNAAFRQSANILENRDIRKEGLAQQDVTNQLNERTADRQDAALAQRQDDTQYNRQQEGLANERTARLDTRQEGIDKRNTEIKDYALGQQKQQDERAEQQYQERQAYANKTIALGGVGSFMDRATADEKGFIDLTEVQDMLPQLVNGYKPNGTPRALVGNDGYITLHDDDGPIFNNGSQTKIHRSAFQKASSLADEVRLQQMGMQVKKGSNSARADARKDFEYYREAAQDMREKIMEMQQSDTPLTEAQFNNWKAIYDRYDEKAEQYSQLSEGGKGLQLRTTEVEQKPPKQVEGSSQKQSLTAKDMEQRVSNAQSKEPKRKDRRNYNTENARRLNERAKQGLSQAGQFYKRNFAYGQ